MAKNRNRPRWLRHLKHGIEASAALTAFALFRLLPLDAASALGGRLLRVIGPRLGGANRRALRNLDLAMPGLPAEDKARIMAGMWDNLGRVIAEYAHLDHLWDEESGRITVVHKERIQPLIEDGRTGIVFSGHIANWELAGVGAAKNGLPLDIVYRAPNNPLVNWLIARARRRNGGLMIPKGSAGARTVVARMKDGGHIGMLLDQKLNDGIPVPFFGHMAMTAPAAALLALRFRCPMVPVQIERLDGARFRVTVEEPLPLPDTGDRQADVLAVMAMVNQCIERWVRERPEQWLWVHNRWPDGKSDKGGPALPQAGGADGVHSL